MDRMVEHGDKAQQRPLSPSEKQRQKDEIRQVVQYCQNTTDCRRSQVLEYFSERFDPSHCYKTCDNCISHSEGLKNEDMTEVVCIALELVRSITASRPIMNDAIDAFRGSKRKKKISQRDSTTHLCSAKVQNTPERRLNDYSIICSPKTH
ncbi:hypothetical protein RSAG8_07100, partial [Rhizoctonia solani AG-8 WAC10335]